MGMGMGMGSSMNVKDDGSADINLWEMGDRTGVMATVVDKPGMLSDILNILRAHDINLSSIQSRPPKTIEGQRTMNIYLDFFGQADDKKV